MLTRNQICKSLLLKMIGSPSFFTEHVVARNHYFKLDFNLVYIFSKLAIFVPIALPRS